MSQVKMLKFNHFHQKCGWMEPLTLNEQSLVKRYLQGEAAAIQALDIWVRAAAQPYRSRLSLWWEDILQDIRLKIFMLFKKGGFRGDAGLKTYIWKLTNHTCIDYLRKHTRKRFTPLEEVDQSLYLVANNPAALESSAKNLGLLAILEKVPEACRQLWRMILSGENYRQMSVNLEISEAALRVRVYRCRKKAALLRKKANL